MKKYIVDTNVFLRFLLKDNKKYYQKAENYFKQAKEGKIELILLPEVVFEIDYVLRGVYALSKKQSADILIKPIKSPSLKVVNRDILVEAGEKYKKINVDLFDLYLFQTARSEKADVLSFDKDFKRIEKAYGNKK